MASRIINVKRPTASLLPLLKTASLRTSSTPWKKARQTNHIERFNNTLRQRVSRLVRETLSFSKKLANHNSVIK
jgi:IS1 family transposase